MAQDYEPTTRSVPQEKNIWSITDHFQARQHLPNSLPYSEKQISMGDIRTIHIEEPFKEDFHKGVRQLLDRFFS
jgi:hypothetical protein